MFAHDETRYLVFGLNLGATDKSSSKAKLLYIWDSKSPPMTLEGGFYGNVTRNFNAQNFMYCGSNSHFDLMFCKRKMKTYETVEPGEDGDEYLGCGGYDIEQLRFASEMFNFKYGIIRPKEYGYDNTTGRWKGIIGEFFYRRADLTMSIYLQGHFNQLHYPVISPMNDSPGNSFILSAVPKKMSNVFAIVYPFGSILWIATIVTVIIMTILFPLVSKVQKRMDIILGQRLNREKEISAFFGFSALLGENMRGESVIYHKRPIRYNLVQFGSCNMKDPFFSNK